MKMELGKISLPKPYRIPLIVLLCVAILVASYFLIFSDQFREKGRLSQDLAHTQQEVARLTIIKDSMPEGRKQYAALQERLQEAIREMPEQKEIPNLLRQVSMTAQGSRTRIKFFAPKEIQPADFYSELPFEIKYSGLYHSLGYFFDGVRHMERIVRVTSFSLEAKGTGQKVQLEGSCLAKTYVFQKEPKPKESKDKKKDEKNAPAPK
jgi:type IV pilus assembly protein PilO